MRGSSARSFGKRPRRLCVLSGIAFFACTDGGCGGIEEPLGSPAITSFEISVRPGEFTDLEADGLVGS